MEAIIDNFACTLQPSSWREFTGT